LNIVQQKIKKQAAIWFARMQNAAPDHPERSQFEAWLIDDHRNAEAYASLASLWSRFEEKDDLQALAAAVETSSALQEKRTSKLSRQVSRGFIGLFILVTAGVIGNMAWENWQSMPLIQLATTTNIGQIKIQKLADGTELMINANSDIEVTYYRHQRSVKLNRGEVIFKVAKDVEKPFVVDSGYAKVTVLGTRFVVNRLSKLVRVSVDHGKVRVESNAPGGDGSMSALILTNGQVAEILPLQAPTLARRTAADAFGFASGTVAFEQADTQEIADVLSRYLKQPVIALPSTKDPRVTALVQIKGMNEFLNTLPRIAPVNKFESNGEILLTAR